MSAYKEYRKCPTCHAKTEEEAQKHCIGSDDCPMCEDEKWEDALDRAERIGVENQYYVDILPRLKS